MYFVLGSFFEIRLTSVSVFAKPFCSSFSVVRIRSLESLDSLLWDLKVLYQFHSWSGTLNHICQVRCLLTSCFSNYRQRSLYGFRISTLIGWVGGDSYKSVYIVYFAFLSALRCMKLEPYTFSYNNPRCNSKSVPSFSFSSTWVSKHHTIELLLISLRLSS